MWSWKCHSDTTFHTSFTILHNMLLLAHTASTTLLRFCKRNCDNHLRFKLHGFMHIVSNFTLPSSLTPIFPSCRDIFTDEIDVLSTNSKCATSCFSLLHTHTHTYMHACKSWLPKACWTWSITSLKNRILSKILVIIANLACHLGVYSCAYL